MSDPLPLISLRVLNTRAADDAEELNRVLAVLGALPLSLPATRTAPPHDPAPLDEAMAAIAVQVRPQRRPSTGSASPACGLFPRSWTGCVGSQVRAWTVLDPSRVSSSPRLARRPRQRFDATAWSLTSSPTATAGRHLASALGEVAGRRILLPRSDIALRDLPESLRDRGGVVTEVVVLHDGARGSRPSGARESTQGGNRARPPSSAPLASRALQRRSRHNPAPRCFRT